MPTQIVEFFVEGEPRPQGSKTPVRRGNKIILIEGTGSTPAKHKAWRASVASKAREMVGEGHEEIDYAVRVELDFILPRPASRHKTVRGVTVKPDLDKLIRAVLDGLTTSKKEPGLILKDDALVMEIEASKYYHPKGSDLPTGVTIRLLDARDHWKFTEEEMASWT